MTFKCAAKKLNTLLMLFLAFTLLGMHPDFNPGGIIVHAKKQMVRLPADDLVRAKSPKVITFDTEVVDSLMPRVLNSSNHNLDVGTGEHYQYLTDTEKTMYRALVKSASHILPQNKSIDVAGEEAVPVALNEREKFLPGDEFQEAYEAARYDFPDLIQLTACEVKVCVLPIYYRSTGITRYNTYFFLQSINTAYTQSRFDQMTQAMRAKRTEILGQINGANGSLQKELLIHDKLLELITYDDECYRVESPYHLGHTAYGALIQGKAVCDGYAMALSYLLDGAGINSMVVSGMADNRSDSLASKGGHAWNIVELGSDWYEVDTTWDDMEDEEMAPDLTDVFRHLYYNITTNEISAFNKIIEDEGSDPYVVNTSRVRDGFSITIPEASATTYSYENVLTAINGSGDFNIIPVRGLSITPERITGTAGTTGFFTATITPDNASNKNLIYKSSDENVIEVENSGEYTITGSGYATVTAWSHDGRVSDTAEVIISDGAGNIPSGTISIDKDVIEGQIGDEGYIECTIGPDIATNKDFNVSCSDESMVKLTKVSSTKVKYNFTWYGSAIITFSTPDGKNESYCLIDVPEVRTLVSFNLNGGTGTAKAKSVLFRGTYGSLPELVFKENYDFAGWYTKEEGGDLVTANTVVTRSEDHTLYAHWAEPESGKDLPADRIITSGKLNFHIDEEGNAQAIRTDNKKIKTVSIGSTVKYGGRSYKITSIANGAYKGYKKLTTVKIGKNIEVIGKNAFRNCTGLKKITLKGDRLRSVGAGSFKNIKKGANITIICKNKRIFNKLVKKLKKGGAKEAIFKYNRG